MAGTGRLRGATWLIACAGLAWSAAAAAAPTGDRTALMRRGEAALAAGHVEAALHQFERAALLEHAADIEMALVRTHMQAGNYRHAVTFSAHTAGAHRQVPEGAALYAWLLAVGGQQASATRLLDEAAPRFADHPFLGATRRLIAEPGATPEGTLLSGPARLQPYGTPAADTRARVVASGVLIDAGRRALVPLAALRGARSLHVRNGLGRGSAAQVEQRHAALGLAVLKLATPLQSRTLVRALGDGDAPLDLPAPAARDPFPGSPGYAVGYATAGPDRPAWPRLHLGFHGMPMGLDGQRALGIDTPAGPRGGPVFDAAGHWAGMALSAADGSARLLPISQLRLRLGDWLGAPAGVTTPGAKAPVEHIYETALRASLQVLARP